MNKDYFERFIKAAYKIPPNTLHLQVDFSTHLSKNESILQKKEKGVSKVEVSAFFVPVFLIPTPLIDMTVDSERYFNAA